MNMLTDEQKQMIINRSRNKPRIVITEKTTIHDLFAYSWIKNKKKWRNNKRLYKKYCKHWMKYIPEKIRNQFLGFMFSFPLRRRINYSEIARKIVVVQPLPPGALQAYYSRE